MNCEVYVRIVVKNKGSPEAAVKELEKKLRGYDVEVEGCYDQAVVFAALKNSDPKAYI